MMSKRLQVLIDDQSYRFYQNIAKHEGKTLGAWVREAMLKLAATVSSKSQTKKLKHLRQAASACFPSGDIDKIISQIETGYTT